MQNNIEHVRFQVLTAVSMKFRVLWYVLLCSEVDVDLYSTTLQNIPEDSKLQHRTHL
jgi:hypothetical protein